MPNTPTSDLLQELQQLEAELHHPGVRCSRARLERLLHPDFHEVGRSGQQYDRDTIIRFLASLETQPSVESGGYAVTALAEDCALLTYHSAHRQADGTMTGHALRSSVWRRDTQGWQLYYHQGTPTAPPA